MAGWIGIKTQKNLVTVKAWISSRWVDAAQKDKNK